MNALDPKFFEERNGCLAVQVHCCKVLLSVHVLTGWSMGVRGRGSVIVPESEGLTKIHENRRKPHRIQRSKSPAYCFYKPAALDTMNLAHCCIVLFSEKQSPLTSQRMTVRILNYWQSTDTDQSEWALPSQNRHQLEQPVYPCWCTPLPLVIAEATENTEREPQVSESPVLPELNLFYTNRCILN